MKRDSRIGRALCLSPSFAAVAGVVALSLCACGDDDGGGDPTPPPPPASMDSGPPGDSGPPPARDAGPSGRDTGPTERDAGPTGTDAGGPAMNVPGRHDVDIIVEDQRRHLIVYVPESVAGSVAAPVVFVVHGTSQNGQYFFDTFAWNDLADTEGFIVVYPDALKYCYHQDENGDGDTVDPGEQHVTTKWSSGFFGSNPLCTAEEIAALPAPDRALADHPLRDDVAFFSTMIDRLSTEAVIDLRRVYATGFSNGAQMTSRLGNDLPDRFAAVASHAGFLEGVEPSVPARPIAFALSVGADDPHWATPDPIPLDETIFDATYFRRTIADYLTMTQLSDAYEHTTVMMGMRTVSRFSWTTSTVGADNRLELAVISGLSHSYPSIEPQLWDFFSAHSLP